MDQSSRNEKVAASGVIDNIKCSYSRRHSVDRGSNDELVAVAVRCGYNGLCYICIVC